MTQLFAGGLPGRLWSLWDMLKLHAEALVGALSILSQFDAVADKDPTWAFKDQSRRDWIVGNADRLIAQLEVLNLRLSIKKAINLRLLLSTEPENENLAARSTLLSNHLKELQERIEGELEDRAIYFLSPEKAAIYENSTAPFGDSVNDKFPELASDVSEAAQCLSLTRNTATVFHLMRAMEGAVKRAGDKIGATVIDKNNADLEWGIIVANMKAKVEAMPKGPERNEWSEVLSLLYHVKQAWRNDTMHPKATYTDDEADAVYRAVKSFMTNLAPLV